MKEKVFIQKCHQANEESINRLMRKFNLKNKYKKVIIKPNLCLAERIPGATTSPDLVKYITRFFVKISDEVLVVESDALLNTADEAFDNLGIRNEVEREGGKIINLSKYFPDKYEDILFPHDLFVNLPVLKTHEFALVTGAVKNMFGMIPEKNRIKYHPVIKYKLVELCKKYDKTLVIMDGIQGMEGHGPTRGKVVNANILIGSENPAALDQVVCKIMQFSIDEIPHIRHAKDELNPNGYEIEFDGITMEEISKPFARPQLDPITKTKMWIWRHKLINNLLFASRFYSVTRFLGLRIRKFVRRILRYEKIDD
jgi:uncharacterized protein (DUF362 family)